MDVDVSLLEAQLEQLKKLSTTLTLSAFEQVVQKQQQGLVLDLKASGLKSSADTVKASQEVVYDVADKLIS